MSTVLEQATAAAQQGNWSLLNQLLQQLPLGKQAENPDLEQVLNLALAVLEAGDFQDRWDVAKVFPKLGLVAIAPLREILEDEDADLEVRWFAARILGGFDHPTVVTTLVELLKTSEDEDLTAMAATALSSLGDSAINALSDLLAEPDSRLLATTALSQIRRPETITPLLSVINDPQVVVRSTAIEALSSFHDSRIPPVLLKALHDHAAVVRKEAVIGLGMRSDLREELDLLKQLKPLLYDFNRDVCQQAAIALGRLGTEAAADALFEVLQSPATPVLIQVDLIRALGWIETATTLNYLQQVLKTAPTVCVQEVIKVLGQVEEPVLKTKSVEILSDFLNSEHPACQVATVKQAAALAWGELGGTRAMNSLLELLAEPTDSVRLHAIAALKNFPNAYPQLEQLGEAKQLTSAMQAGVALALAEWNV